MIDKSKTYRTRDGREVRIYATDGVGCCAVHGAIYQQTDWGTVSQSISGQKEWCVTVWDIFGKHVSSSFDLIEVRPRHKRTLWLNLFPTQAATAYPEKWQADKVISNRIACIKVELDFEEGEGL